MSDQEFDALNFDEELKADHWTQEVMLHTPTFDARIDENGVFWLSGAALREGFSVEALLALARFLSENVTLPPLVPVYDFADFHATPVEIAEAEGEPLTLAQAERWMEAYNYEEITEEALRNSTVAYWRVYRHKLTVTSPGGWLYFHSAADMRGFVWRQINNYKDV